MGTCAFETKNLDPIGSALLTFIGKKQTNKRTPTQNSKEEDIIYVFFLGLLKHVSKKFENAELITPKFLVVYI